jgi:hypothetical protein
MFHHHFSAPKSTRGAKDERIFFCWGCKLGYRGPPYRHTFIYISKVVCLDHFFGLWVPFLKPLFYKSFFFLGFFFSFFFQYGIFFRILQYQITNRLWKAFSSLIRNGKWVPCSLCLVCFSTNLISTFTFSHNTI